MNSRQINSVLWTAAATLTVGAVACALFVAVSPLSRSGEADDGAIASTSTSPASLPPLDALQASASVPLRRVAHAGAATQSSATPAAASATNTPPFTLVGTIGTSLAMLRNSAGQIELKAVGEEAMGATVLAIRPAQVDVRYNGQSVTLQKPKEPHLPG